VYSVGMKKKEVTFSEQIWTRLTPKQKEWVMAQRRHPHPTMASVLRHLVAEAMQRELDKPQPGNARLGG